MDRKRKIIKIFLYISCKNTFFFFLNLFIYCSKADDFDSPPSLSLSLFSVCFFYFRLLSVFLKINLIKNHVKEKKLICLLFFLTPFLKKFYYYYYFSFVCLFYKENKQNILQYFSYHYCFFFIFKQVKRNFFT